MSYWISIESFFELTDDREGVDVTNVVISTLFGAVGGAITSAMDHAKK